MHTPHAARLQAGLSGLELLLLFVGVAMGGFSTVLSTKWVHNALSADGLGAMDVLLIGFAALAIFAILVVFHYIGVRVLPHLRHDMRQASLAIYGLLAVLVVFLSSGSNFQVLAHPVAQRAELNAVREEAVQDFSQTTRVAGDVLALISVMATAAQTAEGLRDDELSRGAVCGRGGGLGRCASEIRSVTIAAASSPCVAKAMSWWIASSASPLTKTWPGSRKSV